MGQSAKLISLVLAAGLAVAVNYSNCSRQMTVIGNPSPKPGPKPEELTALICRTAGCGPQDLARCGKAVSEQIGGPAYFGIPTLSRFLDLNAVSSASLSIQDDYLGECLQDLEKQCAGDFSGFFFELAARPSCLKSISYPEARTTTMTLPIEPDFFSVVEAPGGYFFGVKGWTLPDIAFGFFGQQSWQSRPVVNAPMIDITSVRRPLGNITYSLTPGVNRGKMEWISESGASTEATVFTYPKMLIDDLDTDGWTDVLAMDHDSGQFILLRGSSVCPFCGPIIRGAESFGYPTSIFKCGTSNGACAYFSDNGEVIELSVTTGLQATARRAVGPGLKDVFVHRGELLGVTSQNQVINVDTQAPVQTLPPGSFDRYTHGMDVAYFRKLSSSIAVFSQASGYYQLTFPYQIQAIQFLSGAASTKLLIARPQNPTLVEVEFAARPQ